jgi:hypothetical protein
LEHPHRSALENHVHRTPRLGNHGLLNVRIGISRSVPRLGRGAGRGVRPPPCFPAKAQRPAPDRSRRPAAPHRPRVAGAYSPDLPVSRSDIPIGLCSEGKRRSGVCCHRARSLTDDLQVLLPRAPAGRSRRQYVFQILLSSISSFSVLGLDTSPSATFASRLRCRRSR